MGQRQAHDAAHTAHEAAAEPQACDHTGDKEQPQAGGVYGNQQQPHAHGQQCSRQAHHPVSRVIAQAVDHHRAAQGHHRHQPAADQVRGRPGGDAHQRRRQRGKEPTQRPHGHIQWHRQPQGAARLRRHMQGWRQGLQGAGYTTDRFRQAPYIQSLQHHQAQQGVVDQLGWPRRELHQQPAAQATTGHAEHRCKAVEHRAADAVGIEQRRTQYRCGSASREAL